MEAPPPPDRPPSATPHNWPPTVGPTDLHRAFRVDLAVLRWRAKRARAAGKTPQVIPYTGYGSASWLRILGRVVFGFQSPLKGAEPAGARGWRSFVSVPVADAVVRVDVADHSIEVKADHSGVVDRVIEIDLAPGWHTIGLSCEDSDVTQARVYVVDPAATFGLVSDVDDTVMVTALPRPLLAAWHTFVVNEHARSTTPGMPVLYERLTSHHPGSPVIYLSTGAWNIAPTLTRFLSRNLYPPGALLLTDWGPTADSWFRSGREHKRKSLDRLTAEFPQIKWLLVGDDGQHDVDTYGSFLERHPESVAAVCIRQLTPGEAVLAGSNLRERSVHDGTGVPWLHAPDGAGLADELEKIGLIGEVPQQPETSGPASI